MAESEASKELSRLDTDFNTAQLQWETYAKGLGSGYTEAYEWHKDTLDGIREMRRASSEAMYYVLSALTAGFAGGLAGGLMAPWVKGAAEATAESVMRECARGVVQQWSKAAWGPIPPTLLNAVASKASQDMLRPAAKNPMEYYLDMTYEIGLCFAALRYDVNELKAWADKYNQPLAMGVLIRNSFIENPLLKDQPTIIDMPYKADVAREAELGMWIAWANVRDIDYWNHRIQYVMYSNHYLVELLELRPIVDRLKVLGRAHSVTRTVHHSGGDHTLLDIHALKLLGDLLGGVFFSKVAGVVMHPGSVLPEMHKLRPIYKR